MTALYREPQRREGSPVLRISLERDVAAPSVARAAIAGFFDEYEIDPAKLATLTLLVSELVSNAVVHSNAPAGSEVLLCLHVLAKDTVRVEVIDQGSGFRPVPRDPEQHGGGYGLYLVEKQAAQWGVDERGGTRVWFEMPRHAR